MTDRDDETTLKHAPPSDVERLQVLARLIHERIASLNTARDARRFTPADARELYVLERLRDDWLHEARPQ